MLVASPDALQSDYVQGELTVAKLLNRPIYPIWANGENWIDCVPLDMANYQYVDGRRGEYPHAIETIKQRLGYLADTSKGATSVFLPNYQKVEIDLTQFVNFQDFLDHLFFSMLDNGIMVEHMEKTGY